MTDAFEFSNRVVCAECGGPVRVTDMLEVAHRTADCPRNTVRQGVRDTLRGDWDPVTDNKWEIMDL